MIPKLDAIFARQGIPDVLKSDNGPPFNGHEFKNFSEYLGFKHRRITPYWPRANGEAERLVQTLEKSIRIAHLEGKNWKQELCEFLRQYRTTPHSTTNVSPCEALNNRKLKTTIPELTVTQYKQPKCMTQESLANIAQRDDMQKQKMKIYADLKAHTQEREIKPGEVVLMRQPKHNKLSTPTIQSLSLWRRKRVQLSQQAMVHRLSLETLPISKFFQSTLHRAKRMT